jgi:hypothetical protein
MATVGKIAWFDWSGRALLREDWDFQKCDDWERIFCLAYERAREFMASRQRIEDYRKQLKAHKAWDWDDAQRRLGLGPHPQDLEPLDQELAFLAEFPDKPWLLIPVAQRVDWVVRFGGVWLPGNKKKRERMITTKELEQPLDTVTNVTVRYLQDKHTGYYQNSVQQWDGTRLISYQVFALNWGVTNHQLKKDFVRWLEDNRPRGARPYDPSRKTSRRDSLKTIGARRLLLAYGWPKLEIAMQHDHTMELYKQRSAWSRAKSRAEKELLSPTYILPLGKVSQR